MAKIRFKKSLSKNSGEDTSQSKEEPKKIPTSSESAISTGQSTKSTEQGDQQSKQQGSSGSTSTGAKTSNSESSTTQDRVVPVFRSHADAAADGCENCGADLNAKCAIPAYLNWTICCWRCQTKKLYSTDYSVKGSHARSSTDTKR